MSGNPIPSYHSSTAMYSIFLRSFVTIPIVFRLARLARESNNPSLAATDGLLRDRAAVSAYKDSKPEHGPSMALHKPFLAARN